MVHQGQSQSSTRKSFAECQSLSVSAAIWPNMKHYHLIGMCGTAMASLACMLQARGHRVTGSDVNIYPPMSTLLMTLGIEMFQGYRPEHLEPTPDCVIIGNAIPRGNPEVEETLNRKLLFKSQAGASRTHARLRHHRQRNSA